MNAPTPERCRCVYPDKCFCPPEAKRPVGDETEALRAACPLCAIWRTHADEYKRQLKDVTQRLMNQRRELERAQGYVQRAKDAEAERDKWKRAHEVVARFANDKLIPRAVDAEAREAALRDALSSLWNHLHPEPKMDGSSTVMTRQHIPPELVGAVHAALAALPADPGGDS